MFRTISAHTHQQGVEVHLTELPVSDPPSAFDIRFERSEVDVYSNLPPQDVSSCKLRPVDDFQESISRRIERVGKGARVAVLPDGPLTIPYLST